jgi:hypothetical protein
MGAYGAPLLFIPDPPNLVGGDTKVRLLVSGGDMGAKEIGKLIKLLEAQRAVLEDEDDG